MDDDENYAFGEKEVCMFDSAKYSHGSEICQNKKLMRCQDGEWIDTGNDCNKEDVSYTINIDGSAFFESEKEATASAGNKTASCVVFKSYPRNINQIYLVNKCDDCKEVTIRWLGYGGSREAFSKHKVKKRGILLIRKVFPNGEIFTEFDC